MHEYLLFIKYYSIPVAVCCNAIEISSADANFQSVFETTYTKDGTMTGPGSGIWPVYRSASLGSDVYIAHAYDPPTLTSYPWIISADGIKDPHVVGSGYHLMGPSTPCPRYINRVYNNVDEADILIECSVRK